MSQTKVSYRRAGSCLIILGMISILAAAVLVLFNFYDGERARKASAGILTQLDPAIRAEAQGKGGAGESEAAKDLAGRIPTVLIGGYAYIGEIEIPSLQIRLPVMESWDYDRLKISPCRYSGSYLTDDLVICGHNYQRHFSPIKWIDIGAAVNLITADGQVIRYQVSNRETIQPAAVDEMVHNSSAADGISAESWDLTLFTCNTGGQSRCAVRCIRNSPDGGDGRSR